MSVHDPVQEKEDCPGDSDVSYHEARKNYVLAPNLRLSTDKLPYYTIHNTPFKVFFVR